MTPPNDSEERNAHFRRALRRLVFIVVTAVVSTLALVYYLWEHSPKPP